MSIRVKGEDMVAGQRVWLATPGYGHGTEYLVAKLFDEDSKPYLRLINPETGVVWDHTSITGGYVFTAEPIKYGESLAEATDRLWPTK